PRALRDYLAAQLPGPRCSDSLTEGPAVAAFNAALARREIAAFGLGPLLPAETRPSRLMGAARLDPYWQTPEARRLFDEGVQLRGTGRNPAPMATRIKAEWLAQAARLLDDLERWHAPRE